MDTLIELYDERAIENVLSADVFRPRRVVYLCPREIAQDRTRQEKIEDFFRRRGYAPELLFLESSIYKADRILRQLETIAERYPDCVLDVTGGTDAALFAGGMLTAKTGVPAFTYSRKNQTFYDIHNAPFAENLPCRVTYDVEDVFLMAGGTLRKGRVDNAILQDYLSLFDPFFACYLRFRREWTDIVTYMQRVSKTDRNGPQELFVRGEYTVKGERGSRIDANEEALREFERLGMLSELSIGTEEVSFRFADERMRVWLRDVGSVLELYMYKACVDAGIFGNVISSAIVDWDGSRGEGSVSNEIDVMAVRGIVPLFLSCKTCEIKTEALNELAVLRDRFGGKGAKAAIVTTERCNAAARHRAAQLQIAVIDQEELEAGQACARLRTIMKAE